MKNVVAIRFLENWFNHVWVQGSVAHMNDYYAKTVVGEFNRKSFERKDLEEHCAWSKKNEKVTKYEFRDIISEENKIAFRLYYEFRDQHGKQKDGENTVIFHLNEEGKIAKVWVKSSEQFGKD